jgi:hypothetical protein
MTVHWYRVEVEDTTTRVAYVPLPDSVPPEVREGLAKQAVEHCDAYGNIEGPENDESIVVAEARPVEIGPGGPDLVRSYVEENVGEVLTVAQMKDLELALTVGGLTRLSRVRHVAEQLGRRVTHLAGLASLPKPVSLREQALAKLTAEEKAALGLP